MIDCSEPAGRIDDGMPHRVQRKLYASGSLSRTLHDYYSDAWQVLEVREDSETNAHEQYVWGVHYIDAPLCRDWDEDDNGSSLETRIYYLTDANANVTTLVNPSGTVVERYRYDAYGQFTVLDGTHNVKGNGLADYENRILYAGYRYDADTGLYHVRFRMYHPTLGRWCQRDPVGYVDGLNVYEYVRGRPIGLSDPSGLTCVKNECRVDVRSWHARIKELEFSFYSGGKTDVEGYDGFAGDLGSEDDEPVWIDPLKWFLKKVAPIVRTVTTKANSATGSGSLMVSKISLDIVVTVRYDTGRCNTRSCGDNPANNFEWNKKRLQDTVVLPTKQRQIQPNEMDAFDLADMTHFRLQMYKLHEITSDFVGTHMRKDQITGRLKNHISQRGLRKVGRGRPCRVFGI